MKLNNKGFAISAILYTLLILFTLTLISLIAGLNSRNKMLESYGELTHRSMFFPKPKQIENNKKNSSTHIENLKEIKNKLNTETKN